MKKLTILFAGLFLCATASFGQAIDDRAVIPVAVNLNSILRLNVTSGGNIEFNFNTLADYTTGIANSAGYTTRFTVASSVNWNVFIYAEDAAMTGTDLASATPELEVGYIGYQIVGEGLFPIGDLDAPSNGVVTPLNANPSTLLVGFDGTPNAGDVAQHAYAIRWECATPAVLAAASLVNMLERAAAADRYSTNVFLTLQPN
ncbi:MAG: hypothetical protein ACK4VN_02260 [Bacteroidales bacterium]